MIKQTEMKSKPIMQAIKEPERNHNYYIEMPKLNQIKESKKNVEQTSMGNFKINKVPKGNKPVSNITMKQQLQTILKVILDPENIKTIAQISNKERNAFIDILVDRPELFENNNQSNETPVNVETIAESYWYNPWKWAWWA